jgi:branched-chain amino acid transport system permease protein
VDLVAISPVLVGEVCVDVLLALSIWIMLACGRLTLGATAFAAVGAATTFAGAIAGHWAPALAVAIASAAAGAAAYLLGIAFARLDHAHFAIATLACAVASDIAIVFAAVHGVWRSDAAGSDKAAMTLVALIAVVAFVIWRLLRSREGRALRMLAQDERAAASVGIDAVRVRHLAFVASAVVASLAGALGVLSSGGVAVPAFGMDGGVRALAAAAIGGMGQPLGAIVVSVALGFLPKTFDGVTNADGIATALILLICMIALPGGVPTLLDGWRRRLRSTSEAPS